MNFFLPRKYRLKVIKAEFRKVRNLPGNNFTERRKKSLEKRPAKDKKTSRLAAPFNFSPFLPKISNVLEKHFNSMIFKKLELKSVFEDPPMAALRQPPNLKKVLCRSKLYSVGRAEKLTRKCRKSAPGWKKCGKGSTTCCPFTLPPTTTVRSQVTGYIHTIKDTVDCETPNCIYYWKCTKNKCKDYPKCEYIGLTTRKFRNRLAEHKQYVRSDILEEPSGYHFNTPGHNISHLAGLVLEHVRNPDPFVLKAREFFYIQKFDTFNNGLNKRP